MNRESNLLIIASYPPRGEKHSPLIVGGAMYTKNTLQAVRHATRDASITVLAETFNGTKETYEEDGITIQRFWKRGSLSCYLSLLKSILTEHKKSQTVVIEFEFAMFGDRLSLLFLPLFLLALKLSRKRIVFVFHQVVNHLTDLGEHVNLAQQSRKGSFLNFLLQRLYTTLLLFSDEVIVFEEVLKKRLHRLNRSKRITVIPFGTEEFTKRVSKEAARTALGLPTDAFIVFTFGFIAWYKGSDWLVGSWDEKTQAKLILGGGPNPNHGNKAYYMQYVEAVNREAVNKHISVTGFIPEEKLPLYYEASDLVLLPYRTLMSSSGPLSLAFSFSKPFLISHALAPMFETADIKAVLHDSGLTLDDVTFALDETFPKRLEHLSQDKSLQKKLASLSETIGKTRNWNALGKQYAEIFFKKN